MTTRATTDREKSLAADEFVWDSEGLTEVHGFVADPILRRLRRHDAKKVLDLGCGNGAFTVMMAQHGLEVVGMDYSVSGIAIAQKNAPDVRFEQFDTLSDLPEEHWGRYDAVTAVEVIEHLPLPRRLMQNAAAALKPGGVFILTTPYHGYLKNLALALTNQFDDHWHPLRDHGHVKFFSKATITQLFQECGYQDVAVETVGRIPVLARSMIASGRTP